jgi:hypothetical protein
MSSSSKLPTKVTTNSAPVYAVPKPYLNTGDIIAEDVTAKSFKLTGRIDCIKCKKKDVPVGVVYTWKEGLSEELNRTICQECYCKALDKVLGLGDDRVYAEKALFGETNE